MPPPRLHLDADASIKALHTALVAQGHEVTRTPNAWMAREASDILDRCVGSTNGDMKGVSQARLQILMTFPWLQPS